MAVALLFGLVALKYPIGEFSRAGPGLFPLAVSCLLFVIGLLIVVRSKFVKPIPLSYNMKNIALVLLGLCGFERRRAAIRRQAGAEVIAARHPGADETRGLRARRSAVRGRGWEQWFM